MCNAVQKITDVSEEPADSTFSVQEWESFSMKMEVEGYFETLARFCHYTYRYTARDSKLYIEWDDCLGPKHSLELNSVSNPRSVILQTEPNLPTNDRRNKQLKKRTDSTVRYTRINHN